MTVIFQQPIICPPGCTADGRCPVIKLTTGWLLGREHTPSLGFGHYPSTYKVFSVFVLLDRTLMERIIDNLGHLLQHSQEG